MQAMRIGVEPSKGREKMSKSVFCETRTTKTKAKVRLRLRPKALGEHPCPHNPMGWIKVRTGKVSGLQGAFPTCPKCHQFVLLNCASKLNYGGMRTVGTDDARYRSEPAIS
jgi:hypothetical protein